MFRVGSGNKRASSNNNINEQDSSSFSAYPLDLTVKTQQHGHQQQQQRSGGASNSNMGFQATNNINKRIKIEDLEDVINSNDQQQQLNKTKKAIVSVVSPLRHIQSIADAYLISQLDSQSNNSSSFQRPASTPSPALSSHGGNQNSASVGSSMFCHGGVRAQPLRRCAEAAARQSWLPLPAQPWIILAQLGRSG